MNRAAMGLRQFRGSGRKVAGPVEPAAKPATSKTVQPVMTAEEAAQTWFSRLRELLVMEFGPGPFERTRQSWLVESGTLDSDRAYLYLQPMNQQGFLFEQVTNGWIIGRADKIVAKDTFVRGGEAWDMVSVVSLPEAAMPKVVSRRFTDQTMPFSEYRRRLLEAVRCAP